LADYPKEIISKNDLTHFLKLDNSRFKFLASWMMKVLKLEKLNDFYGPVSHLEGREFIERGLERLNVKYEVSEEDMNRIPKEGPFIVTSNHPFGVLDGFLVLSIFSKVRPDFRIVAHHLFNGLPQVLPWLIIVDAFDENKTAANSSSIKDVLTYVKKGGGVAFFPAGDVSRFQLKKMKVEDKQWDPIVGKIISRLKVPVVPVHFSGKNSLTYQLYALINNNLRLAKLPSELINKKGELVKVKIGNAIPPSELEKFSTPETFINHLRETTYNL